MDKQTDTHRYRSLFKNDTWVTDAQYLTEFICDRHFKIKEKVTTSSEFWKIKGYDLIYQGQIPTANQLLKKYKLFQIIGVLNKYGSRIYSLRPKFVKDLISKHYKEFKEDTPIKPQVNLQKGSTDKQPLRFYPKSKLGDI